MPILLLLIHRNAIAEADLITRVLQKCRHQDEIFEPTELHSAMAYVVMTHGRGSLLFAGRMITKSEYDLHYAGILQMAYC